MRHHILSLVLILLGVASSAPAQGILPSSFDGWSGTLSTTQTSEGSLATVAAEYGFLSGEDASYSKASDTLQVRLYRMKDPSGAYGLYSYLRTPDMPHADLTAHSSLSNDHAIALAGNLVVDVHGKDLPTHAEDLTVLAAAISPHAVQGLFPTLTDHLPLNGLVERSDHYILGPATLNEFLNVAKVDWLGFSQGAEAELAKYRVEGRDLTLLIVDFPTPQTAQKKLVELQQKFGVNASTQTGSQPLYAKRSLTLLAIVSGAQSQSQADKLLMRVESGSEITWSEPTWQFREPDIGTMIVGTIIGTGIICMFALIAGIAFGGFRLVVKRLLPDKVFDRSSHLQVLQLGLGSKPINAEDFYGLGAGSKK